MNRKLFRYRPKSKDTVVNFKFISHLVRIIFQYHFHIKRTFNKFLVLVLDSWTGVGSRRGGGVFIKKYLSFV